VKALLVVDIDHANGWNPEEVRDDQHKKKLSLALKKQLSDTRASKGIVAFVILPPRERSTTGREAQFHYDARTRKKWFWELPRRGRRGCIVCRRRFSRLASFIEHRHGEYGEAAFIKRETNAFTNKNIPKYLRSKGVTEVVLAGCNTYACIQDTAVGALRAGFNITLLEACTYPPFANEENKEEWLEKVKSRVSLFSTSHALVSIENA